MRAALLSLAALGLAALLAAPRAAASDELLAGVNALRAQGCGGKAALPPLRRSAELDRAAELLASGENMKDAMAGADYRALQAAMLEVRGTSDAAMAGALAKRGCKDIGDATYRDAGIATRGGAAWIVLAAPLVPPEASKAGAVAGRVLALVNEARAGKRRCGLKRFDAAPPLAASAALDRVALAHAKDMAARSTLSHAGGNGSTPAQRATKAGYRWRFVGENIAAGQPTPEQVVADWLDSARHCANLMDPDYTEMGIGFAADPASGAGVYWSQVFGTPAG